MGVVAAREQRLRHGLYRRVALEVALDAAEPGTVRSRRTDLTVYSRAYSSQAS